MLTTKYRKHQIKSKKPGNSSIKKGNQQNPQKKTRKLNSYYQTKTDSFVMDPVLEILTSQNSTGVSTRHSVNKYLVKLP